MVYNEVIKSWCAMFIPKLDSQLSQRDDNAIATLKRRRSSSGRNGYLTI